MIRAALLCVLAAGCAATPARPRAVESEPIFDAVTLDERGYSAEGVARWEAVAAGAGHHDAAVAALALEHIEAAIGEGVVDEAATNALARLDKVGLPDAVHETLTLMRARLARFAGDDAAALAFERDAGCGLPWRAGDPVGRLPRVDLVKRAVLTNLTDTRLRGCRVVASTPDGRPGAMPLVLDFAVDHASELELEVGSEAPYQLWADGVAGPKPDDRAPLVHLRRYHITVAAGSHRLVLTGTAVYGRVDVEIALYGAKLRTNDVKVAEIAGTRINELVAARARKSTGRDAIVAAYIETSERMREGDGTRARTAAADLVALAPHFAPALALAARVAGDDGTVPSLLAHDRARRLFERALDADPRAARVRFELGHLALDRERPRDALELAEAAPDRNALRAALLYAEVLRARGRDGEVQRVLSSVRASDMQACALVEAQLSDDRIAHRPIALDHARRLARCRRGSTALGDALAQQGRNEEAIVEYRRVLMLDPLSESARISLGELLLAQDRPAEAVPVYEALVEGSRRSASFRLRLVDALIAAGHADAAVRTLDAGLALDPENAELAAAARSIGPASAPVTADYDVDRIDGRAVIRGFEGAKRTYDGPAVFLLDRALLRVYPTGAQRMITHNIVKVLSKEGIDRWGEWRIPDGAEVLTLCAWKPDGSRLEPEEIAEKESVSIPGLAAGDYVEVEYIERQSAPAAFPGGFLGERFYFGSLEAPLDRSEFVLVTPSSMPIDIDERGHPPTAVITERDEPRGRVTQRTFTVHAAPQRFAEPSSVPMAEYMPSVRPRSRVSREAWQDYLVDFGWGARRRDPVIDALAAKLVIGARDDHEKLWRIDAWVRANIRHGGGLDDAASAIFARREGNRVTMVAALAEAAGLKTRVLLGRSTKSAAIDTDLESYDQALVEAGGVVDDPRYRRGRPSELRPELRGASAMVLEPGSHELVTLPKSSNDARDMRVSMKLREDGSGQVYVEETLRGWPALEWREGLERLTRDRVRPQFEQHTLGYYFPGAALDDLSWENEDAIDLPFIVRYRFHSPALARSFGDALVLPAPFSAQLLRRYVTGAPRQTPLYIDEASPTTLALTVVMPENVSVEIAPPEKFALSGGVFEQSVSLDKQTLTMHSHFFMPSQRVSLADWPKFLAWVTAIDRAEVAIARMKSVPGPTR